nr:zinc finger, CCHC-type [Tanacetum cinerariifolium]
MSLGKATWPRLIFGDARKLSSRLTVELVSLQKLEYGLELLVVLNLNDKHIQPLVACYNQITVVLVIYILSISGSVFITTKKQILDSNLSFIRFEILIEPSKYFNLKVFTRLSDFCDRKFTKKIEVSVIMTNGESVKDITGKFDELAKFEGQDFRRWQKNMHFLLTTLKVVEMMVLVQMGLKILKSNKDDEVAWWVDSGATSHVCKDLCWFQVCKSIEDESFVKMRNIATGPIKGIGHVLLTFTYGKPLCLDNVLYVPGIRKNLVSKIVLNKCGYKQVLKSDKYILSRHGLFVGFSYVCNGMIRLNLNYPLFTASACMITSTHNNSLSKSELWLARLGYVHYKRMRDMSKMSLTPAFDMTHESCKTCMLTKITRQPFKGVNRESKVLDLIHSDLCDFHVNPSLGHNKYVITFIDDASRYCYVYLLHDKHKALDKFKIYKQEVKLRRQDLIKVSRTDRGGEFYDPVYLQSTGIIHQTTAPYTPQQNVVAEKKNRTLKEMVNSMLSYYGLSEGFWGEAMLTACYILNRTPNKNNKQTSYEIWTKKVSNLTYLRIWGCRAVVRLTEPKMKNLGEKDAIFDEERFTSIPKPRGMIQPSLSKIAEDEVDGTDDVHGPSVPRKSTRTRKAKSFGSDFQLYLVEGTRDKTLSQREYCFIIEEDPRTLSEAMASRDVAFWKEAVQSEIDSIMHNDTISTIRLLLALAAIHDLVIHQMDVKTAFLNGDLDEEIYKKQPEGFVMPGHESKGFSLNQADKCVYSKFDASGKGVLICLYVDDMLIFGTDQDQVNNTKEFLSSKFDMKDPGEAEVILGIRIKRGNNGTLVSQLEYSRSIGCLMYAMISTRPDITVAVGKLSKYTNNPSALHWQALGRVFQYLKGTMDYGLTYSGYPSVIKVISMPIGLIIWKITHLRVVGYSFLEDVLFPGFQRNRLVLQAQPWSLNLWL